MVKLRRCSRNLPWEIRISDIYVEQQNCVIVGVDLGCGFEACCSHNLFLAIRRQLKRCSPLDVGKILPVIPLRLIMSTLTT